MQLSLFNNEHIITTYTQGVLFTMKETPYSMRVHRGDRITHNTTKGA